MDILSNIAFMMKLDAGCTPSNGKIEVFPIFILLSGLNQAFPDFAEDQLFFLYCH